MAGIYLHIPFCKQRCSYCDFHFSTNYRDYRQNMVDMLLKELDLRKEELGGQTVETIYFGGGTPSLLERRQIGAILQHIRDTFVCDPDTEITLEANPDDILPGVVADWKKAGINRLSIGIQSFEEKDLSWMNRAHTVQQSLECVKIAQSEGIRNISIDLIYGLPDMDETRWLAQIDRALALEVQHISAYCLTVEEKTALHRWVQQGTIVPAGNEQQGAHFELLLNALSTAGFEQYEISNFARPGFISRHNSNYWKGVHYLGIGPSAHSYDGISRSWNVASNHRYMQEVASNGSWTERETLSAKDRFNELLLTGLRTIWGVSLDALAGCAEPEESFHRKTKEYIGKGWMIRTGDHLVLTPEGRLWADSIAQDLFI